VAVWQATFELLPAGKLPPDYRARFEGIAPRMPSWAAELERWGHEDGDRIDVWSEWGHPTEASVRFDLRAPNNEFVLRIVAVAVAAGLCFRAENGAEVPARVADLILALEASRSARFVADPSRYFNRLRVGGLGDV